MKFVTILLKYPTDSVVRQHLRVYLHIQIWKNNLLKPQYPTRVKRDPKLVPVGRRLQRALMSQLSIRKIIFLHSTLIDDVVDLVEKEVDLDLM